MSLLEDIPEMLAAIVSARIPKLDLMGSHSYVVERVHADGRCDLKARKKGPPASIPACAHWAGGGIEAIPTVGSIVVVSFLDGDRTAPMIGTYQPLRVAGGKPSLTTLDATFVRLGPNAGTVELAVDDMTIGKPVSRVGDTVDCGGFSAAGVAPGAPIIFAYIAPGVAPPDGPPGSFVAITGRITSGSPKVTSG